MNKLKVKNISLGTNSQVALTWVVKFQAVSFFDPYDDENRSVSTVSFPLVYVVQRNNRGKFELFEIYATFQVKKCKNSEIIGQHLTPVMLKIGQCRPSPIPHSGWSHATIK